jgi:hypothetical protein
MNKEVRKRRNVDSGGKRQKGEEEYRTNSRKKVIN